MKQKGIAYLKYCFYALLLYMTTNVAQAQSIDALYEQAKVKIVCKAIQFNCIQQGQSSTANRLNCSSFEQINQALPKNFRSSRKIFDTFKGKTYDNYNGLESRVQKLSGDVIHEVRNIGNSVRKSKSSKAAWQNGVDILNQEFVKIKEEALLQYQAPPTNNTPLESVDETQTSSPLPSPTEEQPNEVTEQQGQQHNLDADATHSHNSTANTGLWITTIFAILLAMISLGFGYMVKTSITHRIKQAEEHFKERFLIMEERLQKNINGEETIAQEFKDSKELNITSKIITTEHNDDEVKEKTVEKKATIVVEAPQDLPQVEAPEEEAPEAPEEKAPEEEAPEEEIPLTTPNTAKEKVLKDAYQKMMDKDQGEDVTIPKEKEEVFYTKFDPDTNLFDTTVMSEPSKDNFYMLYHNAEDNKISFAVINDPSYHQLAINYARMLLIPACELVNKPSEANYVKTVERGWIEKVGNEWKITKKAKIRLEVV